MLRTVLAPLVIASVVGKGALGGTGAQERPSSSLGAALDLVVATEGLDADLVPTPPASKVPMPPQPLRGPPPRSAELTMQHCGRRLSMELPSTPTGMSCCADCERAMLPSPSAALNATAKQVEMNVLGHFGSRRGIAAMVPRR